MLAIVLLGVTEMRNSLGVYLPEVGCSNFYESLVGYHQYKTSVGMLMRQSCDRKQPKIQKYLWCEGITSTQYLLASRFKPTGVQDELIQGILHGTNHQVIAVLNIGLILRCLSAISLKVNGWTNPCVNLHG